MHLSCWISSSYGQVATDNMYIVRESGDKVSGRDDSAALSSVDGWNDILWCLHFSLLQEDCKLMHALEQNE